MYEYITSFSNIQSLTARLVMHAFVCIVAAFASFVPFFCAASSCSLYSFLDPGLKAGQALLINIFGNQAILCHKVYKFC